MTNSADSMDLTFGRAGAHTASFRAAHRDVGNATPITTRVILTVPMSHQDIEAVFWRMLRDEGSPSPSWTTTPPPAGTCWTRSSATASPRSRFTGWRSPRSPPPTRHYAPVMRLRRRVEQLFGAPRTARAISPHLAATLVGA